MSAKRFSEPGAEAMISNLTVFHYGTNDAATNCATTQRCPHRNSIAAVRLWFSFVVNEVWFGSVPVAAEAEDAVASKTQ